MSNRLVSLSAAAALALGALGTVAVADESGVAYNAKTVGALTFETQGLATNSAEVRRQGGFATAGAVQWTKAFAEQANAGAVYGAGSVGALTLETRGLATSAAEVRRQGGAMTAGTVRWISAPDR